MDTVLAVEGLTITFGRDQPVVSDVGFTVARGETVALVGESGSGKSLTALAIMGLLPPRARLQAGRIAFEGEELVGGAEPRRWQALRGPGMGMIFQDPMSSLNPVLSIGRQLTEALISHRLMSKAAALAKAEEMLSRVGIDRPGERMRQYPHEFSGGMRQRVMIAAAMALSPRLLIADEPTTALDVTIQAQVLDVLRAIVRDAGTSLLLITHDMGVVAEMADRVVVLRAGRLIESAPSAELFARPQAAYTRQLLDAVPRIDGPSRAGAAIHQEAPLLRLERLVKRFGSGRPALDRVSLDLRRGETLAIVGESGSGKSTLGRAATRLLDLDEGQVLLGGRDLAVLRGEELRRARSEIQIVFQDPYASLDPRYTVARTLAEPMLIHGRHGRRDLHGAVLRLLRRVGLDDHFADRMPHELSGGQRQRIAIARALAVEPQIIVADEPTSALDVSVQAQILDLLLDLQRESGLGYLFITHDLSVVRRIAHRVAVMHAGRIVELGSADRVLGAPGHAYTRALLAAAPVPDPAAARQRTRGAAWTGESGPLLQHGPEWWVAA